MNFVATEILIDREAAIAQFTALGYSSGDSINLRFFLPKEDPRAGEDRGRKIQGKVGNLPWRAIEKNQREGYGAYFVVNSGGDCDRNISECRAVFVEHDDLPKEQSTVLWQALGLPEPTLQVDTGGKSVHSYWSFEEPIPVQQWRELQADLLEFMDGDRKLKNPSRVMRLAGAFHIKPGREPIQSTIISNSGQRYSFDQLRAVVPTQSPQANQTNWANFESNFTLPIPEAVPIEKCLSKKNRGLIESGVKAGGRNASGYSLAADLLGVADYLNGLGQRFDGDPRSLFDEFTSRCAPPLDSREADSIWLSAQKQARNPALSPEQIEGCLKGWQWRQLKAGKVAVAAQKLGISLSNQSKPLLVDYSEKEDDVTPKLKKPSEVASILSEEYREILAYNLESGSFYRYEVEAPGVWTKEYAELVRATIQSELDSRGADGLYSSGYISSIAELMVAYLAIRHWDEVADLLPLQNGVLELATMRLLPHSPGYKFTWQLPYSYDPTATCDPIVDWLKETQDGDPLRVQLLRAYLKAVLTGRSDLQRYLEILGPGGSGKSTFANLAIALVGIRNVAITTLEQLERNRFETANLKDKRLLYITDSDRYGGAVSIFKSITGGDPVRCEEKNKQQGQSFIPRLLALVVANEPVQSTDYTSGLERRRITVPFLRAIAPGQQRDLLTITHAGMSGDFLPHLPGLLNWVLALPEEEMKALVKQTSISVPSLNRWKAETLIETNPLAEWLDSSCVLLPEAKTYIGVAEKIRFSDNDNGRSTSFERYKHADKWLYANYCAFVEKTGSKPVKVQRFSGLLQDLIQNQLKRPVTKHRDRDGSFLMGVAIRSGVHAQIPSPVTDFVTDNAGLVMAETPGNVDFDGYAGSFQTQSREEDFREWEDLSTAEEKEGSDLIFESCPEFSEIPSQSSQSALPVVSAITDSAHRSSQTVTFKVGDRVICADTNPAMKKWLGDEVLTVEAWSEDKWRCTRANGGSAFLLPSEVRRASQ